MIMGKYEGGGGHGHNLGLCLGSDMEGMRKTMKNFSQVSWLLVLDLSIHSLLSVK
jgi:hypothetical protein